MRSIPEILKTYEKLGIPLREVEALEGIAPANRIAVDAVFDCVSVVTTFKDELKKAGVIFCSISEALREHPDLVRNISAPSCRLPTISSLLEFRRVFGWFVCLRSAGRALPDGALDLFPHQRGQRPASSNAR